MKKSDIVLAYAQVVRLLKAPVSNVALTAGAAMVILGLKEETRGLDIGVSKRIFKKMARIHSSETVKKGKISMVIVRIHLFFIGQRDIEITLHERRTEKNICVGGVYIYRPIDILEQKKAMLREKDIDDIALLENYVTKETGL